MKDVIAAIQDVHFEYPQLRFMQIVGNCFAHDFDPYYVENSDLLKMIKDNYPEVFNETL